MSQVRVHNFSISLDGFGPGMFKRSTLRSGTPGERLHEWMFTTGFWHAMSGEPGGGMGVDHAFAERHGLGIGAEIMGRGKFGPPAGGRGPASELTKNGAAGGDRTRRSTRRSSCSPTTRARRSRWRAAPCSTSSTPAHARRSTSLRRGGRRPPSDVRIGSGPTNRARFPRR